LRVEITLNTPEVDYTQRDYSPEQENAEWESYQEFIELLRKKFKSNTLGLNLNTTDWEFDVRW